MVFSLCVLKKGREKTPLVVFSLFAFLMQIHPLSGAIERWGRARGVAPHPTKELFEKSSLETQKLFGF